MKKIKIFVASSKELEEERKMIAALANSLNTALEAQNIHVIAVEWENLDASVGVLHKQDEYNNKLRECEMCVVLYATSFGIYTKEEFDIAHSELIKGNNPQRLFVYFKDGVGEPTQELRDFRDSFPVQYGHFFTRFQNLDTLKAHFLLQFINYQSAAFEDSKVVELRNGCVLVGGKEYVSLQNVPFAGNNDKYNLLKKSITRTEKVLKCTDEDDPDYKELVSDLCKMKEELKSLETGLWDTALEIAKLSSQKCSERLQRAMDYFNKGDVQGAAAILKEEDIHTDAQNNINLIEGGRKGLLININELLFKIKLLRPSWYSNKEKNIAYEQISAILSKVIEYASNVYGENSKEVLELCKHSRECFEYQPKRLLTFLSRAMEIAKYIYLRNDVDEIISIYRDIIVASREHDNTNFEILIQCNANIVELTRVKYGEQSEKYVTAVKYYAESLYMKDAEASKSWFEEALLICRNMNLVAQEKEILKRQIIELSVLNRDWEWLESLMERYREVSSKRDILDVCIEIAHTGNNDKAKQYYEEAILYATELDDVSAQERIFGGLSRIYGDLKDFHQQIDYLIKSLKFNNDNHITYDCLADAYLCIENYHAVIDNAGKCLEISLREDDSMGIIRSCNKLSLAYLNLGDLKAAEECLVEATEYVPDIVCYENLAEFYLKIDKVHKAVKVYEFLIDNDDDDDLVCSDSEKGMILSKMGWAHYLMQDLQQAEQCYKDSIQCYINDQPDEKYATKYDIRSSKLSILEAYENLAKFYTLTQDYNKAQETLDQSYAFCSDLQLMGCTGRSFWQGVICRGRGEYQKAIDIFKSENNAFQRHKLQTEIALTLLEWDKPTEALDIALKAVEECPNDSYAHEVLGSIYKALSEVDKARVELETSLMLMEKEHAPHFAIKMVRRQLEEL